MTFEDDLLDLERRVLADNAGSFFKAVDELRRMLAMDSGGIGSKLLSLAIPDLEAAAKAGASAAWVMGGEWALSSAAQSARSTDKAVEKASVQIDRPPPAHLTEPLTGLDAILADAKKRAVTLLRSGASTELALAPIFYAAATARARVVTQINAASNAASLTVGAAAGEWMVWEAERDACVHCLALAGHVIDPQQGDVFPLVSYGDVPASYEEVDAPPRHFNCRCRLAVSVSGAYADALRREAQRSILRGYSLQSESQAVRVRAAAKLLDRNPTAPKTVKAYAAAAVKAGKFPTRDVPAGDPELQVE